MKKIFILINCLLFTKVACAEYRVYQYSVKSRLKKSQTPSEARSRDDNTYIVTSTLDPTSYLSYNGGSDALQIDLMRTWTCKGYTGDGKELCLPPGESERESE